MSDENNHKQYEQLLNLRASFESSYISLSNSYLTAAALIITAVSVLMAETQCNKKIVDLFIIFLCLIGISISLIMFLNLNRYTAKNRLIEVNLEKIEIDMCPCRDHKIITNINKVIKDCEDIYRPTSSVDYKANVP